MAIADFQEAGEELERSLVRLLEALRDFSLEVAVIQTQMDHEGASPVFDDPQELRRYLETA
jgi:hypothetical protein